MKMRYQNKVTSIPAETNGISAPIKAIDQRERALPNDVDTLYEMWMIIPIIPEPVAIRVSSCRFPRMDMRRRKAQMTLRPSHSSKGYLGLLISEEENIKHEIELAITSVGRVKSLSTKTKPKTSAMLAWNTGSPTGNNESNVLHAMIQAITTSAPEDRVLFRLSVAKICVTKPI